MLLENTALYHCVCVIFSSTFQSLCYLGQWSAVLINFPNPGAQRQSGNPSGTVGNGHSNNNNTKPNLNYGLKRLGQNNPQNKHKRGGEGRGARPWSNAGRGDTVMLWGYFYSTDSGICVKLCLILDVKTMIMFILGNTNISDAHSFYQSGRKAFYNLFKQTMDS